MSLAVAFAARALSALKASLAAVGLAALAVFFALPAQREALLNQYPLGAIAAWNDSFALPAVVAAGTIDSKGVFAASEVLAKHDERYMPPDVVDALKRAGRWKEKGS